VGNGWSEPEPVRGGPNLKGIHWQFAVTADGTVYFGSDDAGGYGMGDIYRSRFIDGAYAEAENLGETINTEFGEGSPYVPPDESYLIFSRFGQDEGYGGVDLYICFRDADGHWTDPVNMGERVNSAGNDICPIVSPDGEYLFMMSSRNGNNDVYWMDAAIIEELRSEVMR
jgi:hypothetical protein